ncbi:ecdysteroid-regulated 16 kDa protein isoform X1 [Folsomia candida]|uniref:ecdysteroid-regulated 16 kDa protein isoform X1 n=1 Tax=Folsomia candida TaxID=158441 RepID=UPI0016050D90|nr:ecdysteroid-regulated 16 kDa protein isoform X1 [Folsomia candida]
MESLTTSQFHSPSHRATSRGTHEERRNSSRLHYLVSSGARIKLASSLSIETFHNNYWEILNMNKSTCILAAAALLATFAPCSESKPRYHGPYIVNRWYLMQEFSETPHTDCGSVASIQNVEVIPCDSDVCNLKTGTNVTININFTPKADIAKLTAVVHGVVAGVPMPFHFPQVNACQNSNITCPLQSGQGYSYSVKLPVLGSYPKIKVVVKWELKDATGKDVVCVEIPARLV